LKHVQALNSVHNRETSETEKLNKEETKEVSGLIRFFEDEKKGCKEFPKLQELENFKQSAIYIDTNGAKLRMTNEYSIALFLRMYI